MIDPNGVFSILKRRGVLPDETQFSDLPTATDGRLDQVLIKSGFVSDRIMAEVLAEHLKLPFASAVKFPNKPIDAGGATLSFLRQSKLLPIAENETSLTLAVSDPLDKESLKAMRLLTNKTIHVEIAAAADLDRAFDQIYGESNNSKIVRSKIPLQFSTENTEAPAIKMLDEIIRTGVTNEASDLHIEPSEDGIRLRYRIDGKLLELGMAPPIYLTEMLLVRIKVMARLNIAEKRLPQDGRTNVNVDGRQIDIRVSTIPTLNGESIVLRLLDPENTPNNLSALGFSHNTKDSICNLLQSPNGMILATGPTGSGKTTTLYAILNELNHTESKIITLEDPIEYRLEGINQIQINPKIGLDFANLLRSVLRQDPDIIMIGEIRDAETARLAIQAALTGHLVISTLHTNDASGAIPRLVDMGVEPYLLNSAVRAILSQRLVRRLCKNCKERVNMSESERTTFGLDETLSIYQSTGCPHCYRTGFKGRLIISELVLINGNLQNSINLGNEKDLGGNKEGLISKSHGFVHQSLKGDGLARIIAGETSVSEVLSVI